MRVIFLLKVSKLKHFIIVIIIIIIFIFFAVFEFRILIKYRFKESCSFYFDQQLNVS